MLSEDVLQKSKSYADMNHIILLIQFYFIIAPVTSANLFMKHHVIYDLLVHIDYRFVRETITYLITPGDQFLKLPADVHSSLIEYFKLINLNGIIVNQLINPNDDTIYTEKRRANSNPAIVSLISKLPEKIGSTQNAMRKHNLFELIFNNLILGKLFKFNVTQPEQEEYCLPNIDRLPLSTLSVLSKRKTSMLGLSTDLIKLNQKLFDSEIMPDGGASPNPGKKSNEKKSDKFNSSSLKKMKSFQVQTDVKMLQKRNPKAILRKSFTKVYNAISFTKKRQTPNVDIGNDIPKIPGTIYPEKVDTFNINVLENKRLFKENFEFNLKNERHITCLLDCVSSIMTNPLLQHDNLAMSQFLHQTLSDINLVKAIFCDTPELFNSLVTSFVVRLEYKAINNLELTSIFTSGKLICLFLKHM